MKKINYLAASIAAAGLFVSLALVVNAQTLNNVQVNNPSTGVSNSALASITYPVPQLGNCSSQSDCLAYCNDASHMQACIRFAQNHGLVSGAEAAKEKDFVSAINNGAGPGGCNSPESCQAYCSDVNHLQACLSFAKSHGLANDRMAEQGQRILAYIQSGGQMPGGCTTQDSCQTYCNQLSHAAECFAFSQKIGVNPPSNGGLPQPTLAQMQKIAALAQSGQTPGGCATMQACQEYCNDPANGQTCQQFAQQAGLVGGGPNGNMTGPGGCNSPESCQAYCNDPSHQTECLQFAQQHGFMSRGQVQNFQHGMNQFQNGLKNAPQQIITCLQNQVGEHVLSQMQSGQFTPTPDVMTKMQACFQSFRPSTSTPNSFGPDMNGGAQGQGGPQQMTVGEMLQNMPPGVSACVKDKLGGNIPSLSSPADQNFGQVVQSCFAANPPQPRDIRGNQQQGQYNQGRQDFPSPMNTSGQEPFPYREGNFNNGSGTPPYGTLMMPYYQSGGSSTPNFQGQQPAPNNYPPQGQFAPQQPYSGSSTPMFQPENYQPAPGTQTQSSSIQNLGGNILNAISNLLR